MFLRKPKIHNICLTFSTKEKKVILHQLLVDDINKKYETITTKKEKAIVWASHYLFQKLLDLIPIEKSKDKANSDLENLLSFR